MRSARRFGLTICLLLGVAAPGRAEIITINGNGLPPGTDLSHLYPGVTLRGLFNYQSILDITGGHGVVAGGEDQYGFGRQVMGGSYIMFGYDSCYQAARRGEGQSSYDCMSWQSATEIRFDTPTDFVELEAAWHSDAPGMHAYDAEGNEIGHCFDVTGLGANCASLVDRNALGWLTTVSVRSEQRNISRVVFGGLIGRATLTQVSYGVAEPASLGLMLIGLVGAALARRRTRGSL